MRILIALPLLALAACQVTKDKGNDTITAEFNGDVAENQVSAAGNEAENIAADITNDVKQTANKVENKTGEIGNKAKNLDVDVNVSTSGNKTK
jgi:hypothetical protein